MVVKICCSFPSEGGCIFDTSHDLSHDAEVEPENILNGHELKKEGFYGVGVKGGEKEVVGTSFAAILNYVFFIIKEVASSVL